MSKEVLLDKPKRLEPKSRFNFRTKEAIMFYILISPFIVMLFLMKLFPFTWGVIMSFTNYTGFNYDNLKYIGFDNYERVVTDNFAIQSLQATAVIGLITVPLGLFLSFALALLLNSNKKGVGIFRTIYYFPSIIPVVATGLMWRILFNNDGGAFNELLGLFGIAPINWLGMEWCRRALIIFMAWSAGGGILTYLAALKGVPKEHYVYLVHVYQQIFVNQRFGYGLSMIWLLFVFSIICTRLVFYTSKFWVFYENETVSERVKKKKPARQKGVSSVA